MSQTVLVNVRAPRPTIDLMRELGDDGVACVLKAHILLDDAQHTRSDKACWKLLFERQFLFGLVDDYLAARNLLHREARL